ncbi:PREDICTED: adipocyte plasma membrane-associated protein-like [Acromyrmex echinatior]|uniref:Adipocyte plasma membrane-associated protein n=1 Tax=Acromyrmex echinatior TaxID=103372 RepID=F4WFE4_ACREC|nr:PREDICTED: adipocyte plasma membrane-associated protein-like [Acromyrmex echinatior]XP_011051821.1 PREDICTED: adipocyte plasma membrane-associated protein-like [Acromyrmex echinatior]EGI67195.1 Adipocyte plasma membrane-associated protein [Acromyrmex echinatior]
MGYLKLIGTVIIYIGLILAVITFMPGLPPETEFVEYSINPPRQLDPKLGPKNRLNGIQKLFINEIHAPESLDSYNGQIYTGVHGGYVLRIEEDRVVPIVKFGEKCDGIWQEHKCGRPLGLKFDKKGNLYVADAYYGIFQVNVATGEYKNIVNITKPIDGKIPRMPNSIDIAKNGDIYWSDSNSHFAICDLVMTFLINPSGRLIRYNAAKKENEVLIRNIAFANGVILNDDESFVLVVETLKNRIMKYNLKGPKAGQHEIFIDRLPGIPDNIHSDSHGGFLLSLIIADNPDHPQIFQSLAPHPYLRKMLTRLLMTMELPFKLLNDIYPNPCTERILHAIGSYQGIDFLSDPKEKSSVLRIDASGNIIEILTADDGSARRISSAYIQDDFLWFGSPFENYLGRVPLKQAFPDLIDDTKQSFHTKSEKQLPNVAASNVKTERAKRDTDSTTIKPIELNRASQITPKPTAAPTTITPKPKTTATPKPSPIPKTDKPTATASNVKSSETKSSTNAEAKKDNAKIVDAKLNSPKSEKSSKKEDTTKTQSEKKVKVEQNASVKQTEQKSQSEKVKRETNRPRDDL